MSTVKEIFNEIYNKRRTRIIKEEIKTEEQKDATPKEIYIEDINGEFVCISDNGVAYIKKLDLVDINYVKRVNGSYWNMGISNPSHAGRILQFRKEPYIGEQKFEKVVRTDYRDKFIRDKNIVGTALAFTSTIWELLLCSKTMWRWFRGLVTDGYAMIFLSPIILIYWILVSIMYLPIFIILSLLVVLSLIYTPVFEFPAAFMNKEKNQFFDKLI